MTFFTLCCKNVNGSVLVWERFTFHVNSREFWKFGSVWRKRCFPLPPWHVGDRGETELRNSPAESYFWKTGVQLKSHPGQCDEWEPGQWKNYSWLQEELNGPYKESSPKKKKKKDKEKKPGCKKSSLPVENYYCQITGYALKAAFMYIPSIVLWDDPAIKDTPNHCLLSWKRYLLSEATLKNLNSLQGNTKMSRLTDIRQDRY